MANKYLKLDLTTGKPSQEEALVTSAGAGDAGKIPALDSTGKFDPTLFPAGFGAEAVSLVASEALSAGDLVSIWDDTGVAKVRKADATTTGKKPDGFVLAAVTLGNPATVYSEGENTQLTGLTIGAEYYLDKTTAGGVTADVSGFTTGNVVYSVGVATSATTLLFKSELIAIV